VFPGWNTCTARRHKWPAVRLGVGEGVRTRKLLYLMVLLLIPVGCAGGRTFLRTRTGSIPTPVPADGFTFPLEPGRYGPYVQGVSGPLDVDTRFGVQNSALGETPKCFEDQQGRQVPFRGLYHAGEDWFRWDAAGQVDGSGAAGDPVRAVADGVVTMTQQIGSQGWIVVLAHRLLNGTEIYSAYWHVSALQVGWGDVVERGQVIARVHDQGGNSHLHWEIRAFGDGSALFGGDSAGGRGTCNGRAAGVAYTWDDVPERASPVYWGYFDPVAFVESHQP
jgi:hypothetical protein